MVRRTLGFIGAGIALALALTTPAAAINVPACGGDFVLFGPTIVLEQSPAMVINGNIMSPFAGGKVSIGNQNTINGTVSGDFLKVGSGVTITTCVTNNLTLGENSSCVNPVLPFVPCAVAFPPPPLTVPNVPLCVNGAPPAGFVLQDGKLLLPIGVTATLPPGCYGAIVVDKNAHLVLTSGAVYDVKQIRVRSLGSIEASVGGSKATLNVLGEFITNAQVKLTDLDLNLQSNITQHAWNENVLTNVIVNQPLGTFHFHSGSVCVGCEIVALKLDIQPITTPTPPPGVLECVCPQGSALIPGANPFICQ